MNAYKLKENIYWVGAVDWNLRHFHGYETNRGTTYNAYLILDEKVTLIDTVKEPFTPEMLSRIRSIIPPEQIEIIISNHVEPDHSGALPAIMSLCPHAKVYTIEPAGVKGLTAHYGTHPFVPVKSGDGISIGKRTLSFLATPMLHWPDNMITYCPEEKILFSNDAFGQHLASGERTDEEIIWRTALEEAKKYFANILMCYRKQAQNALNAVQNLKPETIAPSHGVIWQSHVADILQSYALWSADTPPMGAVVVYDSMWLSTEKMARSIGEAFRDSGIHTCLYNLQENHPSDILPEILTSRYLAVGSPTLNGQMMPSVAGFLCYLKGLSPVHRKAFAFGSYGWGGQSIPQVEKQLLECGFDLCTDSIRHQFVPTEGDLHRIYETVKNIIKKELASNLQGRNMEV